MDITFQLEGEVGKRAAHRERVRGLVARIDGEGTVYVVHDVSASGVALVDPEGRLAVGRVYRLALCIGSKELIGGLPASMARRAKDGLAGVAFGELNLRQEAWLDKLILEIQKRRIDLRKSREGVENPEDKKTDRVDEKT
ncbi:MAG: PilZ domain-containing protein [Acidobacteriota bacterium]